MIKHLELRGTFAEINLKNLAYNYRKITEVLGENAFLCPMVKANAYGHGDIEAAKCLTGVGAKILGVCSVAEGLRLRRAKISCPILVFDPFGPEAASAIVGNKLTPVISHMRQISFLEELLKSSEKYSVHIKFNTGMNRLGFPPSMAKELADYFKASKNLKLEGVCSHLSDGEDAGNNSGNSAKQLKVYFNLLKEFKELAVQEHILNSAGIFNFSKHLQDKDLQFREMWPMGARPGIALYGAMSETENSSEIKLKPVMTVKSKIRLYQLLAPGDHVSYGGTWTATRPSVVGIVPLGYEDGYSRQYSNKAHMIFRGQKAPVIGTVCMDYVLVDLTDITGGVEGEFEEEVIIFGGDGDQSLTAAELAKIANTISYEVLTSVGARVPRHYI